MRFLISIIFIAFLGLQNLTAQSDWQMVTVSDTVVDFGSVTAYQQHEQILTIHNNSDQVVQVLSADFEENVFSTDLNPVPLSPQSDMNFSITFESDQNVNYTDFLHIELDHGIHPIIIETSAQANYEESYYNATQNKWGSDLKSALHNIIKGHTQYSYSDLWDILSDTDEDPANPNNVILIYTGWSYPKSNHGEMQINGTASMSGQNRMVILEPLLRPEAMCIISGLATFRLTANVAISILIMAAAFTPILMELPIAITMAIHGNRGTKTKAMWHE